MRRFSPYRSSGLESLTDVRLREAVRRHAPATAARRATTSDREAFYELLRGGA
jgi:hypothetical protein